MFSSSLRPKKFRACGGLSNHTVPHNAQKENPIPSQPALSGALLGGSWGRGEGTYAGGGGPTGGGSPPFNKERAHAALDEGLGTSARWSQPLPHRPLHRGGRLGDPWPQDRKDNPQNPRALPHRGQLHFSKQKRSPTNRKRARKNGTTRLERNVGGVYPLAPPLGAPGSEQEKILYIKNPTPPPKKKLIRSRLDGQILEKNHLKKYSKFFAGILWLPPTCRRRRRSGAAGVP